MKKPHAKSIAGHGGTNRGAKPKPDRDQSWRAFEFLVGTLKDRYHAADGAEQERPKVVFILGAGASLWSGMPLWGTIREQVVKAACQAFPGFLLEACMRLETSLGWDGEPDAAAANQVQLEEQRRQVLLGDKVTTDQICSVANDILVVRRAIIATLKKLYFVDAGDWEAGLPPQLGYELLAHMLKHGFADHAITFNFDDLLPDAMLNELGENDHVQVVSDHAILEDTASRRDLPHIVQIHGSIRSVPTLRFTRDATEILTSRMKQILLDLLFRDGDQRPLHVISLGYSWNDPDFAAWIVSMAERVASLTVVTVSGELPPRLAGLRGKVRGLGTEHIGPQADPPLSIDHLLWAAWKQLKGEDKQSAARHVVLGHLFGPEIDEKGRLQLASGQVRLRNQHTHKKRFAAEVLLHVIKCQGMVTASVMANDFRIRRYRKELSAQSLQQTLEPLVHPGGYPEVRETMFTDASTEEQFKDLFRAVHLLTDEVLVPRPDPSTKRIVLEPEPADKFLIGMVRRIWSNPEVEIVRTKDPRTQWIFNKSESLTTLPAFRKRTHAILGANWTHLFAIAETGEWLTHKWVHELLADQQHVAGRRVLMINAALPDEWQRKKQIIDLKLEQSFRELSRNHQVEVATAQMPWWQHNRHMTLAVASTKARAKVLGGIFFQRPHKASRICPVYVDQADDCGELLITFLTYVRRALERQCLERSLHAFLPSATGITAAVTREFVVQAVQISQRLLNQASAGLSRRLVKLIGVIAALSASIPPPGRPTKDRGEPGAEPGAMTV